MAKPPENSGAQNEPAKGDGDILLDQAALDALFEAAMREEPSATPAPDTSAAPEKAESLNQGDIDALLGGDKLDEPLVSRDIDGVLGKHPSPDTSVTASHEEPEADSLLSQDMIDALVTAAVAQGEEAAANVIMAAPPPPKPEQENLLSQDDLDALLAQAQTEAKERRAERQRAMERALASASAPPPPPPPPPAPEPEVAPVVARVKRERKPGRLTRYLAASLLKTLTSLSVGVAVSFASYNYLYTHPRQDAGFPAASMPAAPAAEPAHEAQVHGEEAAAQEAHAEEEKKLEEMTPAEREKAERHKYGKEYVEIASSYSAVLKKPRPADIRLLRNRIDDFINTSPSHPKAVDALLWKARLCEMESRPYAVRETYRKIISSHGDSPLLDAALLGASETANKIGQPAEAVEYAQKLISDFPDSKLIDEAQVALADAYISTGKTEEARAIYDRIAGGEPGTRAQAGALVGMAKIAIDQGNYEEAAKRLEARMAATAQTEGVDEAQTLLAKAYHGAGRLAEARETLNTMIKDHPDSPEMAGAMMELTRVLDDMGLRADALQVARQAAEQFPSDAQVLRTEGALLALEGKYREAGDVLLSADKAGLNDPQVMIEAARNYSACEAFPEAAKTYERVLARFPRLPQAFVARMELAEVTFRSGKQQEGIRRLEQLAKSVDALPQRLPIIVSLARMYEQLGLHERAAELSKEIATASTEPEVLAQAATALLDGHSPAEGAALADRVDISKLTEKSAYNLLVKHGRALLSSDPPKAANLLERAYGSYPTERTPGLTNQLVRAYLAANDVTRTEQLLSSIEEEARLDPIGLPKLRSVAIALGDYLYEKKDFTGAARAYERALVGDDGKSPEYSWSKYQRANALLQAGDYAASLALYDAVAKSTSPWSREAAVKADVARAKQRVRIPPESKPEPKPESKPSETPSVMNS